MNQAGTPSYSAGQPGESGLNPLGTWVLLQHDVPRQVGLQHQAKGSHFDLMLTSFANAFPAWAGIQVPQTPTHNLLTFRLPLGTSPLPHLPGCPGFAAQPIPPHRGVYLDYSGPLSGNRGSVNQRARGAAGGLWVDSSVQSERLVLMLEGQVYAAEPAQSVLFHRVGVR